MKAVKDNTHHTYDTNDRVKLKQDRADVYKMAHGGSEGIIRERGLDEVGNFPMVYIEWDKDHWLYNGEPDMWTFEDHFELVEGRNKMSDEKKFSASDLAKIFENPEKLASLFAETIKENTIKENEEQEPVPTEDPNEIPVGALTGPQGLPITKNPDEFIEALTKAMDSASESEAFLVVSVKAVSPSQHPDSKFLIPDAYIQYQSEPAAYALQAAVSSLGDTFFQDAIARILQGTIQKEQNG